jgi:bidirectional [NiFe] hydrogenase diaphorase subunit
MPQGPRYVVCNADEGDPGAFMDRSVLEGDPHRLLEGMAIAAYAVGADQGFIYMRAEYPLAIERLRLALNQARQKGLLGRGIAGTSFDLRVDVRVGAGAYVCGEETALLQSIQGERGMPRPRPPFPAQAGLWAGPHPDQQRRDLHRRAGRSCGKGPTGTPPWAPRAARAPRCSALSGAVRRTGLVEVPMGTPLTHRGWKPWGGECLTASAIKAVQTGGPSGGASPTDLLDTQVDYESLQKPWAR